MWLKQPICFPVQWFSVVTSSSQWLPVVLNGLSRPQSNLNVHTGICSAFAVPTSPGICVLKLVLHVRTLGTMITGYCCQLCTHFVLISCHYCNSYK